MSVLESKILLDLLTPSTFIVEVHVRSLFVLVRALFGFIVALEPCQKILVIPISALKSEGLTQVRQ